MSALMVDEARGEEAMTDFQFRAIMAMVSEMLSKCKTMEDLDETKKAIEKLSGGLIRDADNSDDAETAQKKMRPVQ